MSSPPPPSLDPAADDSQFQRLLIDELIEMGAAIMRGIHFKANAKRAADRSLIDLVEGFEQVSRAIRRGIIMAIRSTPPPQTDDAHRAAARTRLIRQVEAAIDGAGQRSDREQLLIELAEQPDSLDPDDEIPDVPLPIILAEICRDLGRAGTHLRTRAWRRHVPADVLALCTRAAR